MKIPKQFTVPIIVHAISKLDLQLLDGILRPIPESIKDKIDISLTIFRFKMNIDSVFYPEDTYFEVVHDNKKEVLYNLNIYTFTANYSRLNFTLQIIQDEEGMINIKDHFLEIVTNQKNTFSFLARRKKHHSKQ